MYLAPGRVKLRSHLGPLGRNLMDYVNMQVCAQGEMGHKVRKDIEPRFLAAVDFSRDFLNLPSPEQWEIFFRARLRRQCAITSRRSCPWNGSGRPAACCVTVYD